MDPFTHTGYKDNIVGYDAASKILGGVPINTLKDWRAKGRGPRSAVIAGKVRYRVADLEGWLDKQFEQRPAESMPFTPLRKRSA
ncbi:helix-turn-helix domain-containing protein [Mycobacterium sp. 1423905.2]|uniref:helix-turn-helix domain-containing protein n=1 Tax=Mycobacterium sp. 1423905.2 TaxID=1856859 RepID=UPI0009F2AD46|nr:helix-turn-helix domain-containing protein [Mycobacterium sp. 1423905.2]